MYALLDSTGFCVIEEAVVYSDHRTHVAIILSGN